LSIQNTVLASVNHIALPWQILPAEANEFDVVALKWPSLPVQVHVLDFKAVQKLHTAFYSVAAKFRREAEARNSRVVSINFRPDILRQVRNDGMESVLGHSIHHKISPNVGGSADTPEQIRSWITKYAVEAAREAMNTMFNATVAGDENYHETPKGELLNRFFKVAVIHGTGQRIKTVFRLFFERETLEALTRSANPTGVMDEELMLSIPGELINIIYTSVKSRLNDLRGYDLPPSLPSVTSPEQVQNTIRFGRGASWIPLVTPLGAYYLQIELGD